LDFELDLKFKFAQIDPHYRSFTRTCFTNSCRLQKALKQTHSHASSLSTLWGANVCL